MTVLDANAIACDRGPSALRSVIDEATGRLQAPPEHAAGEAPGLPLRFWLDLGNPVPPDRLVKQLLGEKTLALLVGEPGSGKSFLATDLALHIALGRPWFGRPVLQGAVVYIAAEGAAGMQNRVAAFRQAECSLPDAVPFALIPGSVTLGKDVAGAMAVIEAVQRARAVTGRPVHLVVIDTLARSFGAGDENSASEMSQYIRSCDEIRVQTGATILIVHHSAKNGSSARGSSALMGAVDTCIEIENRNGVRTANVIKQKDGADGRKWTFELEPRQVGFDADGDAITSCVVVSAANLPVPRSKLTELERRALGVFKDLVGSKAGSVERSDRSGCDEPVPLKKFREALQDAGVTSRDKSETERKQWQRIQEALERKRVIVVLDDVCRLAVT